MISALLCLAAPSLLLGGIALGSGTEPSIPEGEPLRLHIEGVAPGSTVVVHAFRTLPKWNGTATVPVLLHAWAEFRTGRGRLDVDAARPRKGSYAEPSGRALLWSAYPADDPAVPPDARRIDFNLPDGSVGKTFLVLEEGGRTLATGAFRFARPADLAFEKVDLPGLNGVFAYPKGARALPVVIGLHGSEGGSISGASGRAATFAARGYATLAVNYFAYPRDAIPGVPTSHSEVPVETIERARAWLAKRPEADVDRLGLYGVSKGAEFAVLAASVYPWVKAAVAVVPSDVVWEGYRGEGGESGTSSWSFEGKPFPYIPLYSPDAARFRRNTDRYETSRNDHPKEAKAAEIPVGKSKARFLLLGSDRDEVWASGRMVRLLAHRLPKTRVEWKIFPKAGHQISGTGIFPPRLYGVPSTDPRDKDLTAEGAAAEEGWERTLAFLGRSV